MKRLFQVVDLKTGKRVGDYYEKKKLAKAARNASPQPTKVSVGPDHWRYKND
jgi:hypothetical protein